MLETSVQPHVWTPASPFVALLPTASLLWSRLVFQSVAGRRRSLQPRGLSTPSVSAGWGPWNAAGSSVSLLSEDDRPYRPISPRDRHWFGVHSTHSYARLRIGPSPIGHSGGRELAHWPEWAQRPGRDAMCLCEFRLFR